MSVELTGSSNKQILAYKHCYTSRKTIAWSEFVQMADHCKIQEKTLSGALSFLHKVKHRLSSFLFSSLISIFLPDWVCLLRAETDRRR